MYRSQSTYSSLSKTHFEQQNCSDQISEMHNLRPLVVMNLTKNALHSSVKMLPSSTAATRKLIDDARYYSVSKGPQKQVLLRYPAFPLKDTLERFLITVQPLVNDEEFCATKAATKRFEENEGAELQELLEKKAKCEENWLAGRWQRTAYLQYRNPVTVYVSPGMTFPTISFPDEDSFLKYAGQLVYGMVRYKQLIDAGELPILKMGKYELDNSQFSKVYGTCRIPQKNEDKIEYSPNSKHMVVIHKHHFYKMDAYNCRGVPLHPDALACEFKKIVQAEKKKGIPFGVLTTDSRDNWAAAYEQLMKIECNSESIKAIQSALFTVSLDECVDYDDKEVLNVLSGQLIHGGGVRENSGNRWMDKTIQLIVNPNGMSGFCYEHSPAEGQPIANITEYVCKNLCNKEHYEGSARDDYPPAIKLPLRDSVALEGCFKRSKRNINKLAEDLHVNVLHFKDYGKGFLKKQKLSPDSYIQIALQFAYYKLHKVPGAQYESAHLRIYINGRTETIRSCSNESISFARAMESECSDKKHRVGLLRAAINCHRAYTTLALQGKGVDRHLLGLKLMALEHNKPIPDFYKSPGYVKSLVFRVSTSQVATSHFGFLVYGPAVDDGYSCCYNPRENDMLLACTAWRDNPISNVDAFANALSTALKEMQELLIYSTETEKAKL